MTLDNINIFFDHVEGVILLIALGFVAILGPTYVLFIMHVKKKYGVYITKFTTYNRYFHFKTEFNIFMKKNPVNFILGVAAYGCSFVGIVIGLLAMVNFFLISLGYIK